MEKIIARCDYLYQIKDDIERETAFELSRIISFVVCMVKVEGRKYTYKRAIARNCTLG